MNLVVRLKVEVRYCGDRRLGSHLLSGRGYRWTEVRVGGHGPFCPRVFYATFDLPRTAQTVEMVFSTRKPKDVDALPCYLVGTVCDDNASPRQHFEHVVAYLDAEDNLAGSAWERGKTPELDAFFDTLWDGRYWVWLEYR